MRDRLVNTRAPNKKSNRAGKTHNRVQNQHKTGTFLAPTPRGGYQSKICNLKSKIPQANPLCYKCLHPNPIAFRIAITACKTTQN